jgi:hypothetical protein
VFWCGVLEAGTGERKKLLRLDARENQALTQAAEEIIATLKENDWASHSKDFILAAVAKAMQQLIEE